MGKLRKDKIDDIQRLGGEGYTKTEIAKTLDVDRGTVRKYLANAGSPVVLGKTDEYQLPDDVKKILYNMQGIMGLPSILDAVKQSYRDEVAVMKFKLNAWEKYGFPGEEFSVERLIGELLKYIDDLEYDREISDKGWMENREIIANLKEQTQVRYDEGYAQGKKDYMIIFRCSRCGKPMAIRPGDEVHQYLVEMLAKAGWGHAQCI